MIKGQDILLTNFIFADERFGKALRIIETCVSIDNNFCGKLAPSLESPTTFEERFKITWVLFFIADFLT